MSSEIDYLLSVESEGVKVFEEAESCAVRVAEWLDTPQGQMWGAPHWGNRLVSYKHEPINEDTAAAIENSIIMSLPVDVPSAVITFIRVSPTNSDSYWVKVGIHGQKEVSKEVKL